MKIISKMLFVVSCLAAGTSVAAEVCQTFVDSQRILHIKAVDADHEPFCIGYAHGKQRAVQMDYFRRTVYGTNSEVHGFSQLKSDMMMKLLNLPMWAEKIYSQLAENRKAYLQKYSDGVNLGIQESNKNKTGELSLGYPAIDPWQPVHSIAVLLLQSFDQTRKTFTSETEEYKVIPLWHEKSLSLYQQDNMPWESTILKKNEVSESKLQAEITTDSEPEVKPVRWWAQFPEVFGKESGSNNWVVNSSFTKEKVAMLANDPHLDLKTPIFWFWMHIESPEINAIGATLPGVPVIVSGVNKDLSWGLTNAYYNTADIIELTETKELNSFFPLVWVKWHFLKLPVFFKKFQKTSDGYPIVPIDIPEKKTLALRWTGFHIKPQDIEFIFTLMKLKTAENFDTHLKAVGLPSWNFVFADTAGNIGFRIVGNLFKATTEEPIGFAKGTTQDLKDPSFVNTEDRPHLFNPKRGWIVTANNRHFPPGSPLSGGRSYTQSFRANRIEELLTQNKQHTVESFENIQCDHRVNDAVFMVPLVVQALKSPATETLKAKLLAWDMQAVPDCEICGIYRKGMMNALEEMQINETGFYKLAKEANPVWQSTVDKAFLDAEKEIGYKKWRDLHVNSFAHITKNETWKFSPEIPTSGDKHSVSPGSSNWDPARKVFIHTGGASKRMIVKMKSIPEIWLNMPGMNTDYSNGLKLNNGENPWQDWEDCKFTKVQWPVEWDKVSGQESVSN